MWRRLAASLALIVVLAVVLPMAGGVLLQRRLAGPAPGQAVCRAIERQTSQTCAIGRLAVTWSPFPVLKAEDVMLGATAVLRIGHVRATIGLWPLLHHVVRIDRLRLDHVTLDLARDASGQENWRIRPMPSVAVGSGAPRGGGGRWRVALAELVVNGAALSFHDARSHHAAALHLTRLAASGLLGPRPRLEAVGLSHGAGYDINGTVGALARRSDGRKRPAWPVSLRASESVGGVVVSSAAISGTIADPMRGVGYDLLLSSHASDLAVLNRLFPHAGLPSSRDLSAVVRLRDDVAPRISVLRASAGATAIPGVAGLDLHSWSLAPVAGSAALRLAASGSWNGSDLRMSGMIVPRAAGGVRLTGIRLASDQVTIEAGDAEAMLTPAWRRLEGDLSLRAALLVLEGQPYRDLRVHLRLRHGRLSVDPFTASGMAARLSAETDNGHPSFVVWMRPMTVPATLIGRLLGRTTAVQGPVELVGEVAARGDNRRQMIASASGHLGVSMTGGTVSDQVLAGLIGHGSALDAIMPHSGNTALRCLALHATLGGGRAGFDTIALQVPHLSLGGRGSLSLDDGGLDLRLVADALLGAASAGVPVHVRGTVQDPLVSLEATAPGGRYALTISPVGEGPDPCAVPLNVAREGIAGTAPPPPASHGGGKASRLLRSLGLLR